MIRVEVPVKTTHIRLLDVHRDLSPVADLIEICFASTLDADGREYLRQIRRAAADPAYLRWVAGAFERVSMPLFGYIWEQDRRVIGNLSLIPIYKNRQWVYLIANVAVHPDYRRQGIARELTLRALDHIRERRVRSAWLQVRDDNASAYHLYRASGFVERSRRTTWVNKFNPPVSLNGEIEVTGRRAGDWEKQRAWLEEIYPLDVTWNLSYELGRFHPGILRQTWQWLNGETQEHWAARSAASRQPLGFASWEPQRTNNDQIWLCAPPETEDAAARALLPHVRQYLAARRRPINVNFPFQRAVKAFSDMGFSALNTLIWMENRLDGEY